MAIALSGGSDGNNLPGTSSQQFSPENKKAPSEMVGGCSVCSDDQGTEENPLVYCDGCEVAVHQACYGIIEVPPGNWFCRKCESGESSITCALCPSNDGALKQTENKLWAHVVCALYIPEVMFGNNNTMEPIELKHIKPDRYQKKCHLCEEAGNSFKAAYGASMDCHRTGCKKSFHVTCAQAAGLLFEESENGESVIYCGYCKHHFRKLKAGDRKSGNSLNNSGSSYLDSASDSSQDNYPRCNTTENDKNFNRTNMLSGLPTNLSKIDSNNLNTSTAPIAGPVAQTPQKPLANNISPLENNSGSIGLTIPLNSSSSLPKTATFASTTDASAISNSTTLSPQKKKRAPKNVSSNPTTTTTNNDVTTLSANTETSASATSVPTPHKSAIAPSASSVFPQNSSNNLLNSNQDPYRWVGDVKETNQANDKTNITNNNNYDILNNNVNSNKNNKKKQPSFSTQSSSSKPSTSPSLTAQPSTNYNLHKIGSPNLSSSTSPSLASPSNSTKSTSNSSSSSSTISSSTTSSSSSSSTPSNSPSPALLSPNVSNRGTAAKLESPLASNSKTGNNIQTMIASTPVIATSTNTSNSIKLPKESTVSSNKTLPFPQNSLQTRINLVEQQKFDSKKNNNNSRSSLLSTTVPISQEAIPATNTTHGSQLPPINNSSIRPQDSTAAPESALNSDSAKYNTSISTTRGSSENNSNTQLTVPPLIIPVPQPSTNNSSSSSATKSTAKPKAAPKSSRKKSTETNEAPPKPKPSRSKKNAAAANNNTAEPVLESPKPDPKKGKAKATPAKSSVQAAGTASTTPSTSTTTAPKSQPTTSSPSKRKSRSASNESNTTASPAKRSRKKKVEPPAQTSDQTPPTTSSSGSAPFIVSNPQPINSTSTAPSLGTSPLMINTPSMMNSRLIPGVNPIEGQDMGNRYFPSMISPYASVDYLTVPSLSRSSLSRLFTSSSAEQSNSADDPGKAFEELRDNVWSHLSKCVLEQSQQFDIPSLIGTLYTLRSENEKLVTKVRDLTMKRDQLVAMNARLDLPGPMLTQHLSNTSPGFSSVVAGLSNSPKSLPASSPGSAISKQPLISIGSYSHPPPGPLGPPPSFMERSSPIVGQPHSGLNNIKSSISTPSPPIGALMAHSTSNRAGLITVNHPYMSNVYPPANTINQIGPNPAGSSYYPRQ